MFKKRRKRQGKRNQNSLSNDLMNIEKKEEKDDDIMLNNKSY